MTASLDSSALARAVESVLEKGNYGIFGALKVSLGGTARYHGHDEARPTLGSGPAPTAADIGRAVTLVEYGVGSWLIVLVLWSLLHA